MLVVSYLCRLVNLVWLPFRLDRKGCLSCISHPPDASSQLWKKQSTDKRVHLRSHTPPRSVTSPISPPRLNDPHKGWHVPLRSPHPLGHAPAAKAHRRRARLPAHHGDRRRLLPACRLTVRRLLDVRLARRQRLTVRRLLRSVRLPLRRHLARRGPVRPLAGRTVGRLTAIGRAGRQGGRCDRARRDRVGLARNAAVRARGADGRRGRRAVALDRRRRLVIRPLPTELTWMRNLLRRRRWGKSRHDFDGRVVCQRQRTSGV